jgi:hypothetical protein
MDENQMYIMGVMTIAHIQNFVQVKNLGKLASRKHGTMAYTQQAPGLPKFLNGQQNKHNGLYPTCSIL